MESEDPKLSEEAIQLPTSTIEQPPSLSERLLIPTLLAGAIGGGVGLLSKRRKAHPNIPATYATNSAIVAACYCGVRELVKVTRKSQDDDLMNSAIGGLFSGALLGRLQGGPRGAFRYSIAFATFGTAFDYASLRSKPFLERVRNMDSITLPVWFPIQILDEEALAKKKAEEQKLFPRLNKEES
ncbi:hypothetical protein BRARA_D00740 [Brassica rapa]|uniref:Mitochondrial import inner membrane translocase subunit Tim17/Tim22/Tim23 family protein n=2 Tax=Brassica TaxID=3705 RepID=A0A397ZIT8_BRACM|nr:uncharacterized protein LOC103863653 [Brassica rapa]XP_013746667.1 uncharacterized protein BNAA04G07130D [Brassica napus]RID65552.1 hypothetical protein BRARA_D00740 [Brassica rapa]CAF2270044.1 unnamed protein product [Brassica napus]CAG7906109.1 unnamed protein product [Brassica rapa]VDD11697.1 unnamed protein product [Brassica rapa]